MTKNTKIILWFLGVCVVVFIFFVGFGIFLFKSVSDSEDTYEVTIGKSSGVKLAVVELKDVITSSEEIVRQFKKYGDDKSIKGILFRVDSPGGGVVASQEIYEEIKKVRDNGKPVVVSMGSVAASGGYYVACGGSRIVANRGTLTGSIGVIMRFLHYNKLMDKIGVDATTVKTGALKDAGSPWRPSTPEDKKYFDAITNDVYNQFIEVVAEERDLTRTAVLGLADGRVFTGEQALDVGLVDTLGTYEDAVNIAAALAGIKGEPQLVKERKRRPTILDPLFGYVKEELGDLKEQFLQQPILQYRLAEPF
jgi:protease IV